jgi:hypothetical protein
MHRPWRPTRPKVTFFVTAKTTKTGMERKNGREANNLSGFGG